MRKGPYRRQDRQIDTPVAKAVAMKTGRIIARIEGLRGPSGAIFMGVTIALIAVPGTAHAKSDHGRVVHVIDADTFRLEDGLKIRIAGIDAAETRSGQAKCAREIAIGKAATERVKAMIEGRRVTYHRVGRSYDRAVAKVWFKGLDLGETLVAIGAARPWPRGKPKPDWCQ